MRKTFKNPAFSPAAFTWHSSSLSPYFPTSTTPSILESLMRPDQRASDTMSKADLGHGAVGTCSSSQPCLLLPAWPLGKLHPRSMPPLQEQNTSLDPAVRIWVKSECLVLLSLLVKYGQLAVSQGLPGLSKTAGIKCLVSKKSSQMT